MKRPYLALYTRDWLDDPALRQCSPAAQGVLLAVMCLMHESVPYGYLQDVLGVPFSEKFVLSRTMFNAKVYRSSIAELESRGRLHRTAEGVLYCQRMVRDEDIRVRRAAGGLLGGNPTLKVNHTNPEEVNLDGYHTHSRVRSRAENDSVSALDLESINRSKNLVRAREVEPGIVRASFEHFWDRWCALTKRKQKQNAACQAWISVVEFETEAAAMACLERYGASDEVRRGIVKNPDNWIYEQARDKFTGEWQARPEALSPAERKSAALRAAVDRLDEQEAL